MATELGVETIGLLGDLVTAPSDFHKLQIDAVVQWIKLGCPHTARGASNGIIRFKVVHDLESGKVYEPLVIREIHQFRPYEQRQLWTRSGEYGHPLQVLATAIAELTELARAAAETEESA